MVKEKPVASIMYCARCNAEVVRERSSKVHNRVLWTVFGETYRNRRAAAEVHNVSTKTIQRWCKGYSSNGEYFPPREGCSCREEV